MGRRSQKTRTGQAKDRAKRAASESGSPDSKASQPPEPEDASGDENETTSDKPARILNAENDAGGDKSPNSESEGALDGEQDDEIAAGYASMEADQKPQTCCSNCKTVFEVTPELLSSKDTRVRCGECLSIFDALVNLRHPSDEESADVDSQSAGDGLENDGKQPVTDNDLAVPGASDSSDVSQLGATSSPSSLDVTYADFSLFSADAALPEIDYLDETREIPAFDFDDPGGDDDLDETFSETLFAHGPEVDARSAIDAAAADYTGEDEQLALQADVYSVGYDVAAGQKSAGDSFAEYDTALPDITTGDDLDALLNSLQRPESHIIRDDVPVGSWWLRGGLLLLVLVLVASLFGYRERETLQHSQYVRPVLESLCSVIGCTLARQVDLASLQVLKRSVFSHPKLDNVLVINIAFINRASFSQRYPVLEIRLTDRTGRLVVKNTFEPSDYLDNWQAGDLFAVNGRLDISLNVEDPGNDAMSFELAFL